MYKSYLYIFVYFGLLSNCYCENVTLDNAMLVHGLTSENGVIYTEEMITQLDTAENERLKLKFQEALFHTLKQMPNVIINEVTVKKLGTPRIRSFFAMKLQTSITDEEVLFQELVKFFNDKKNISTDDKQFFSEVFLDTFTLKTDQTCYNLDLTLCECYTVFSENYDCSWLSTTTTEEPTTTTTLTTTDKHTTTTTLTTTDEHTTTTTTSATTEETTTKTTTTEKPTTTTKATTTEESTTTTTTEEPTTITTTTTTEGPTTTTTITTSTTTPQESSSTETTSTTAPTMTTSTHTTATGTTTKVFLDTTVTTKPTIQTESSSTKLTTTTNSNTTTTTSRPTTESETTITTEKISSTVTQTTPKGASNSTTNPSTQPETTATQQTTTNDDTGIDGKNTSTSATSTTILTTTKESQLTTAAIISDDDSDDNNELLIYIIVPVSLLLLLLLVYLLFVCRSKRKKKDKQKYLMKYRPKEEQLDIEKQNHKKTITSFDPFTYNFQTSAKPDYFSKIEENGNETDFTTQTVSTRTITNPLFTKNEEEMMTMRSRPPVEEITFKSFQNPFPKDADEVDHREMKPSDMDLHESTEEESIIEPGEGVRNEGYESDHIKSDDEAPKYLSTEDENNNLDGVLSNEVEESKLPSLDIGSRQTDIQTEEINSSQAKDSSPDEPMSALHPAETDVTEEDLASNPKDTKTNVFDSSSDVETEEIGENLSKNNAHENDADLHPNTDDNLTNQPTSHKHLIMKELTTDQEEPLVKNKSVSELVNTFGKIEENNQPVPTKPVKTKSLKEKAIDKEQPTRSERPTPAQRPRSFKLL